MTSFNRSLHYIAVSVVCLNMFFFFKQETAYEMLISDWSSDVCSSDLIIVNPKGNLLVNHHLSGTDLYFTLPDEVLNRCNARAFKITEIGRASCRERVCQYV